MNILLIENNIPSEVSLELYSLYNAIEKRGIQLNSQKKVSLDTISIIKETKPNCVVILSTDLETFRLTCTTLCDYCRQLSIPIFMISLSFDTLAENEIKVLGELGVSKVFTYPFHPDKLTDAIIQECNLQRPADLSQSPQQFTSSKDNTEPAMDAISKLPGVKGCIEVSPDGAALDIRSIDEERENFCRISTAYSGNVAQSISMAWNLGKFLHGAVIASNCKLLLHPDGENFLGTTIDKSASAASIGQKIELYLKDISQ